MTSMRRRFLINQCQIITFLILKYDIIENSRIELRGIVLPVQVGGLLGGGGGGGGKGYVGPPSQIIGGGAWPPWPPLFLRLLPRNKMLCKCHSIIIHIRVICLDSIALKWNAVHCCACAAMNLTLCRTAHNVGIPKNT